jgi:hypothetical protein
LTGRGRGCDDDAAPIELEDATTLHASAAPLSRPPVAAIASPQTSVCDYANVVLGTVVGLGFGAASLDPSSGIPLLPGETPQGVLAQLKELVATAKAVTPPDGMEDFHAELIAAYETFVNALPPAVAALTAGDTETAHAIVDAATKAVDGAVQDLEQAYPDVKQQIEGCN